MPRDSWRCNNDEHINRKAEVECEICGAKRPVVKSFNYSLTDVFGNIKIYWEYESTNAAILLRKRGKVELPSTKKEKLIENVTNKEEITLSLSNEITTYSESLKVHLDKPEIVLFYSDKDTVLESKRINLSWEVKNAVTVSITGIGKVEAKGSIIKETFKTPFKIIAENDIGKADALLDLKIIPLPRISEFCSKQQKIEHGKETQLVWNIEDAEKVELHYPDNMDIVGNKGEKTISPTSHTQYKLIVTALDGITKKEKKITVQVFEKVELNSFSSDLVSVREGLPVKLKWAVKNAAKIILEDNLGTHTDVTHESERKIIAKKNLKYFKLIVSDPLHNKLEERIEITVTTPFLKWPSIKVSILSLLAFPFFMYLVENERYTKKRDWTICPPGDSTTVIVPPPSDDDPPTSEQTDGDEPKTERLKASGPKAGGNDTKKGGEVEPPSDFKYSPELEELIKEAEAGNVTAMFKVAVAFYTGNMGVMDYGEAMKRLSTLDIDHNHTEAQYYLGRMYEKGEGVPQDYAMAISWYKKAAEKGHNTSKLRIDHIIGILAGNNN